MTSISKRSFLGIGLEAASGTALVTPTVYHPTKSTTKATKKREKIDDERANRDGPYGIVDTNRSGTLDGKGNWYNDTSPYFLIAALGGVTSTQPDAANVPTVYKHTMNLTDVPKTLTAFKSYDNAVYVHAYSAVSKFGLKFAADGKVLENDVSLMSLYPVKYSGSTLTPTFSTMQPFAGYMAKISFNGSQSNDVSELDFEFTQKISEWFPPNGSPDFTILDFGERDMSVSFTARFDSDTLYNKFLAYPRVDDSLTIDFKSIVPIASHASTDYYQELSITLPVISYDDMTHDLGKENVLIKGKATVISTAAGFISAYVQNTIVSYTV